MRASHQADQRATSHRSALDFRFCFFSFARRVLGSAERSDADLYQDKHTPRIKTSTRLGAKVIIFL